MLQHTTLLALTIRQPWASLIVLGLKRDEIRNWRPSFRLPLTLAIHAGARLPDDAACDALTAAQVAALRAAGIADRTQLPLGLLLGTVEVVALAPTPPSHPLRRFGRWAWQLADAREFRVKERARGALGFWDVQAGVEAARDWLPGPK